MTIGPQVESPPDLFMPEGTAVAFSYMYPQLTTKHNLKW